MCDRCGALAASHDAQLESQDGLARMRLCSDCLRLLALFVSPEGGDGHATLRSLADRGQGRLWIHDNDVYLLRRER